MGQRWRRGQQQTDANNHDGQVRSHETPSNSRSWQGTPGIIRCQPHIRTSTATQVRVDVARGATKDQNHCRPSAWAPSDSAYAVSVVPDGIRTYWRPSSMYVTAPAYKADPVW